MEFPFGRTRVESKIRREELQVEAPRTIRRGDHLKPDSARLRQDQAMHDYQVLQRVFPHLGFRREGPRHFSVESYWENHATPRNMIDQVGECLKVKIDLPDLPALVARGKDGVPEGVVTCRPSRPARTPGARSIYPKAIALEWVWRQRNDVPTVLIERIPLNRHTVHVQGTQ